MFCNYDLYKNASYNYAYLKNKIVSRTRMIQKPISRKLNEELLTANIKEYQKLVELRPSF